MTSVLGSCLLLSARSSLQAQPKELVLSPAEQPSPPLRYRFLPISSELNPGDAAPMYLRLDQRQSNEIEKQIFEKHESWNHLPLERFPVQEARKFVDRWGDSTRMLRIGTRRQFCDWSYPLAEQRREMIWMLLPDCQSMSHWARLLSLKAKVETAEHAYEQAVDTIETGMAFGRHVGAGPFLINNSVGVSICSLMVDRIEELISQPGAPSLYWALTSLPRPLVSMRDAMELEQRTGENMVAELDLTESGIRAESSILLERLYKRLRSLAVKLPGDAQVKAKLRVLLGLDLASYKKENLATSREYLKKTRHLDDQQMKTMPEDEIVLRALVGQYTDMRDDLYKLGYLPWRDVQSRRQEAERRLASVKAGPLTVLAELQASVTNSLDAQTRLDRRVAVLRVVEAVRIHAAAQDGGLADALNQITEVPVPEDPATGKPFEYRRDGAAAVLTLPEAGLTERPTPSYRITIRK